MTADQTVPMPDPLYPAVEPYAVDRLAVGDGHTLYVEQCGNPAGFPALFLHGGPGSHTRPQHRQFFDPQFYRAVLFDQRGCGRSTPLGGTAENTTYHLLEDIESLRRHLHIDRMMLFGGSWGSTLALAYASTYPDRVAGMILRGIFLASRAEVDWYLYALRNFLPEASAALAQGTNGDLVARYHASVNEQDERKSLAAARRWVDYEEAVMSLGTGGKAAPTASAPIAVLGRARVQLHYLVRDCFLQPGELLEGAHRLAHIPTIMVQGRLDMACPPRAAFELAARLPHAELRLIERGGHAATEPSMATALRRATDDIRAHLEGSGA
jgi:proline iminopeptidase